MPDPADPSLTFLFTDLEGSTRLWEEFPQAMRHALARHDDLLRECIEGNGGRVFKTQGDAFCAVFPDARGAVNAALAAQLRLPSVAVVTPEGERPLKVRMALHSGTAEQHEGDYFGPTVNRVARLVPLGHGGQVLLSGAAWERVRDRIPPGASLEDMGEHRLKDLGTEHVFQLRHSRLAEGFPPLRSLDNPALQHNLPRPSTAFIGREKELGELKLLLGSARLVTLTGPGGTGKTRLALQAAADLLIETGEGAWLVELAALTDPALVPAAAAAVLGLKEERGRPVVATLTEHLKGRRLLLVLDNCEHLLEACARMADAVLRECPDVRLLTTSREGLGIYGETIYRVPGLTLPPGERNADPAQLLQSEAARLFRDRAAQVRPGFALTPENAPMVASLCRRLDGIPLALELAAARVGSLSVREIHAGLDQRFGILTGGASTALPRQQTLRSLIDWSYDLLNGAEKALLGRLSVFAGGWTLEAAEAVCAGEPLEAWEVLDVLTSLTDKSLVTAEAAAAITRYRLLETVREYAGDRLREAGEADSWRRRHLEYCTALGREAEPHLGGAAQKTWLERLDREHDNLRAALEWALRCDPEAGLPLAGVIWRFWDMRGYLDEGRRLLTGLLERTPDLRSPARVRALHGAGLLAFRQGDTPASQALYQESLELGRELGDRAGVAAALNQLGNVAWIQGDFPVARARHEESLNLRKELGDRRGVAASLNNLGNLAMRQGDLAGARASLEGSLEITREFGDIAGIGISLNNLGNVLRMLGEPAAARAALEESLKIRRELGDRAGISSSLNNLAMALSDQGDYGLARELYEEALQIARELGDRRGIAHALGNQAEIAYDLEEYAAALSLYRQTLDVFEELGDPWGIAGVLEGTAGSAAGLGLGLPAGRLLGAAARLREEIGAVIPPPEQARYQRQTRDARQALKDEAAFRAAWEEGRRLALDEAVALARSLRAPGT